MKKQYLIIGGGHQGLAMAAHLSLSGEYVNLWNRSEANIAEIIKKKQIYCGGVLEGTAVLEHVSTKIGEVYEKTIFVTVPANAYRDIAKMLASYVDEDTVIILNPGRTFGAIDFMKHLRDAGCKYRPKIAETQTIVYTCRRDSKNSCRIYAFKKDVLIAAMKKSDMGEIMERIPECMRPYFKEADNMAVTSLGNVGMILHCAPVLMNIGWIENETVDLKYYYEGISKTIADYIEEVDKERQMLAEKLGVFVESTADWMRRTYQIEGNTLYECIRNNDYYKEIDAPATIHHRYLLEDVPCGLVPLESLGKFLGEATPYTTLIINLACAVIKTDFRRMGRHITKEALEALIEDIRSEKNCHERYT